MTQLYEYVEHPTAHEPININEAAQAQHNYNHRIAQVFMTILTAMPLFWFVLVGCILWFVMNGVGVWTFDASPFALLATIVSVAELPLMLIITIGQEWEIRRQELVAEELYNATIKSEHNLMQVMAHLSKQDELIIKSAKQIERIEQIEQSEVLKIADAIVEVLEKVKKQGESIADLASLIQVRRIRSKTHD